MEKFLEIGKIIGTKGLKGELLIEPWCDSPEFLKKFKRLYIKKGETVFKVVSCRIIKSSAAIYFDGIDSIDDAQKLRGQILYMNREDVHLEKGRYFIQDLIGIEVFDAVTEKRYGKITNVFKTGANDVYQITDDDNKDYLVPVIPDVVKSVDIENQKAMIIPIKGIFEDEN
ncbi:MAG: ribosome maturation factor RimM [Clostridia bacterium]|nr:ribosome maturation factor RimM [Clostridia bacterium]